MGCGPSAESNLAPDGMYDGGNEKFKNNNNFDDKSIIVPLEVNEKTLTSFLMLEREISEAEAQNPMKPLDLKAEQLLQLTEKTGELEQKLKRLEKQASRSTEKPTEGVQTHNYFIKNGVEDELNPDQEKHLDLLNEKEIVAKELETTKQQYKKVSKEVRFLESKAERLQGLYKKQDKLLDQVFGGEYGSLRENQLEQQLDQLEAQSARILEANFKWRQGQMMLEYACRQLGVAVQKWKEVTKIPTTDLESRYDAATEARNNIVAAGQNIEGAQRYLDKVKFPYCNEKEVSTLNKAAQYVFTDMQIEDRHSHAYQCYRTTHKRANALLQWFDTVINTTIMKDLHEINEKVKAQTLDLRRERVRLIKLKVKELYGTDVKLDQTLRGRDISTNELAQALISDNQVVKVEGGTKRGVSTPPLLSDEELAPVPSNSVIFGKMYDHHKYQLEDLTRRHQDELQLFLQGQENTHNKIKGTLEEKLMMRRQRRARMTMEEIQKNALKS